MDKRDVCNEVISQLSEFIYWDYGRIEVFDYGPEFGVSIYSKEKNRIINFVKVGDIWWIYFKRKDPAFFRILRDTNPSIYFNVTSYFKDNEDFKQIHQSLDEKNHSIVISEYVKFMKNNLMEVINGEKWIYHKS